MVYLSYIISVLEVLILTVPVLLSVAFVTIAERKTMASMQRRLGPNTVGYYGLLQAFADALKLLLKEYVSPTQANLILFFLGPIITLIFSLLGYAVIPYGPGLCLLDSNLGILFLLAVSSLATYGILLAGWSANSKYAFLGSLRSTAQLISYELLLTSAIFLVVLLTSSLNLTVNIEIQKAVWLILPLFPVFILFFIAAVAETNRAPFDLAEAESELVSGFMTEHSAVIFVFFFLAEYASIVLICIMISIFFLGGYNINFKLLIYILDILECLLVYLIDLLIPLACYIYNWYYWLEWYIVSIIYNMHFLEIIIDKDTLTNFYNNIINYNHMDSCIQYLQYNGLNIQFSYSDWLSENVFIKNPKLENLLCSLIIAIKTFIMIFIFIWARASLPRIRFDQLMSDCWTILLPLVFAFILIIPCFLYVLNIMPNNVLYL